MTDELAAFLRARLADDAAGARLADTVDPSPWRAETYDGRPSRDQDRNKPGDFHGGQAGMILDRDGNDLWDCEGSSSLSMTSESAEHAARHDPARVLAEVEAKRQLLARGGPFCTSRCDEPGNEPMDPDTDWTTPLGHHLDCTAYAAARVLALPYAGHPGYKQEWRP